MASELKHGRGHLTSENVRVERVSCFFDTKEVCSWPAACKLGCQQYSCLREAVRPWRSSCRYHAERAVHEERVVVGVVRRNYIIAHLSRCPTPRGVVRNALLSYYDALGIVVEGQNALSLLGPMEL